MSKKLGLMLLLAASLLFAGFVAGVFVGKNINDTEIVLKNTNEQSISDTQVQTPSQDNAENGLIDINTATVSDLIAIPGIGEVIAQRIIDYRQEHGNFTSIDDLLNVSGIGETRIRSLSEYITVGG